MNNQQQLIATMIQNLAIENDKRLVEAYGNTYFNKRKKLEPVGRQAQDQKAVTYGR